jgi:septal ring factor EnvC (AmiA/AmiB activator)
MDAEDRRGVDRLTIQEAARRLGISEGAVRKRVTRGSLQHEKEEDGRVYIYLDAGGRPGVDDGQDDGVDPDGSTLISRLESEVAFLRNQVQRQQEIIAQQAVTMRQLTAAPSQESPEDAETVEAEPEGTEPRSAEGAAQEELDTERARREKAETTMHEGMTEERRRREEAERERDELRRQLYGIRERRESAQKAEEQQGRGRPHPDAPGAHGPQRRPWWRRMFRN